MNKIQLIFFLVINLTFSQEDRKQIHVKYISSEISIDGELDETDWSLAKTATDFYEHFPNNGAPSKYKNEIKVMNDDQFLYIGIKVNANTSDLKISSLKRDFSAGNSDNITMIFDTFNDATNAFVFGSNHIGVQREMLLFNGGNELSDWDMTWDKKWLCESKQYEKYYITEWKIPLSAFKYTEGETKWRVGSYQRDTKNNAWNSWHKVPTNQEFFNLAFMGDMIFEKPLGKSKSKKSIIPYVNNLSFKDYENSINGESVNFGGDVKLAIDNSLTLDLTLNPDFSQVEVDQQVTNLTRYEVTLPEKRQFFIDNGDLFGNFGSFRDAIPFFSRRIGIAKDPSGNTIQNNIIGGIRLSGKLDQNWRIGVLNIQNQEDLQNQIASNNNSMFALQRKVFGQSQIGLFMVNRQTFKDYAFLKDTNRFNRVIGLDYNLNSANNKWLGKFYTHKSIQPDDRQGNLSAQANLVYNTRIWRFSSDWVFVDQDFRSDLGFIPRSGVFKSGTNMVRNFYPKKGNINSHQIDLLNLMWFQQDLDYQKTDHIFRLQYQLEFKNQSQLELNSKTQYVYLSSPFDPTRSVGGIPLPDSRGYNFGEWGIRYLSPYAKSFNFTSEISYGTFFNGTRFSYKGSALYRIQPIAVISLLWDYNRIELPKPYSSANLFLISPKFELTLNKNLFWSTLIQYSNLTDNFGINSRIQWRFAPLSDLYLVYNDNYYTQEFGPVFRSINLKLTYWLNL